MTKSDLIDVVSKAAKINKRAAGEAVDATFEGISRAIKKSKRFQVPGFGTFTVMPPISSITARRKVTLHTLGK